MANVYDVAYDLEQALRNSEDFQALKNSYDEVNNNPETKVLFGKFRDIQVNLQQKQMSGQEVTQEEIEEAQKLFAEVQQNETISQLMAAEQRMSTIINDLNKVITKPLEELYGPMVEEDGQQQ
ncbi:YlbF family regulator [Fictibacillus phosphorivorans]|uniref:YlbF family regulator n=1 Tax=Fictibacillus phosphorivorans TaxID=1221500 RepID=UPI002040C9BF|nr:YlbF family regulator [Fictibacillus phosphorivorans]MCM3717516.1 YlbF family regulator [Fictibacillus phosphorivorans]MCM3775211.1 YlbF family regulator [Fictibacillus phosphorivorans]